MIIKLLNLRRIVYFLMVCLLTACIGSDDSVNGNDNGLDWSIFRGSPSLCGYTDCALPDEPLLRWSIGVNSRTEAAPIVYD